MIRRLLFRFRALFIVSSSLLIFCLGLGLTFFPFQEIETLRTGYFQVRLKSRNLSPKYVFVKERPKRWMKLENISSASYKSVLANEDARFFEHHGVDFEELAKSLSDWLFYKKEFRSVRTIDQKLARNLFLGGEETLLRQLAEFPLALYIDWRLPKNKILESYLNALQ